MMNTRKWAGTLIAEMRARGIGFTRYPKVVAITGDEVSPYKPTPMKSTKGLRGKIDGVWRDEMRRRDDPIAGFAACLAATLQAERNWSVEDAALHTIRFILRDEQRRPKPPRY